MTQQNRKHDEQTKSQAEGLPGFTPRLPDPFEVQRLVEREVLGLHMAQKLF